MIIVDVNLLIYAINIDSHHHSQAKKFWQRAIAGNESVGMPWSVVLAFLRLTTNPRVMERPLEPESATEFIDEWLARPNVEIVYPAHAHWEIVRNLVQEAGTAGNLTSDTDIAALAIEHGAAVYSADHDFARFAGVRHVNPLRT